MRILVTGLLVSTMALTACGRIADSRINPLNWFGKSREAPIQEAGEVNPLIPKGKRNSFFTTKAERNKGALGDPVDQITDMTIARTPGGALLTVTGLPLREGAFEVTLDPENDGEPVDGVLTYTLKAFQPTDEPVGTPATRQVTAAVTLTDQGLAGVRRIVVKGARNAREVRR